ncbi:Lar family restriction alleviation protein [Vibrio cholerae]
MSDDKNCPFCGGEPKIYIGPDHFWRVICSNVWLCGAKTVGFEQKCDAINTWNTRAESAELNTIRQQNYELADENKLLREALEKALSVVNRAAAMEDSEAKSVRKEVRKLLLELGGE